MSSTPILSYKKPSKEPTPASNVSTPRSSYSPNLPSNSNFTKAKDQQVPQPQQTTRKISSRRKALQEFYHLQQSQQSSQSNTSTNETISTDNGESTLIKNELIESPQHSNEPKLSSIEDVEMFVKNSSNKDILVYRNKIQSQLDSSNQRKKEIIYDNYYELIKLSKMLEDITDTSKKIPSTRENQVNELTGFKIYENDEQTHNSDSTDEYINDILQELSDFNSNQISNFTDGGFKEVIKRLNANQDRSLSSASMAGIYNESEIENLSEEEKSKIINQLNYILSLPDLELSLEEQSKAESLIDKILESNTNEVLNLQLNTIKNRIH
ncbi:hypothetical protein KGF54_000581 [Candida jiufengensis]|uniref:uncharacterized protein n=1 Tax=Candida jiufengensis TaxID=497108 RepID=UPI00222437B4|nr:uncharacterized protein KGF54_000581 [Candida jiufengensis]KAI5956962.1 hypothetical protein KGF54_000581 [Candida jiufengensis]